MTERRPASLAGDESPSRRGRAVDPRLVRFGHTTRRYLGLTVVLGSVAAVLIIWQAWLLAAVVAGSVSDGEGLTELWTVLFVLLGVIVARAVVAWVTELAANRTSAAVKSQLRSALVERVGSDGPAAGHRVGDVTTLATGGVDALDGFYSRYLPQLVLAVIVPVAILTVVFREDWISGAIILFTLPLIPVFMVLIGLVTRIHTDRQLGALQMLSGHFLDVVEGLTTLKVFGRSKAQIETIRTVTGQYRRSTMATLRIAFLSSLVLELLASVAVALVAVSIGLRLLHGHIDLRTGFFILVLAPEAYLPLRLVGQNYHASAEGMSAADQVFEVLEAPAAPRGERTDIPSPTQHALSVDQLRVSYPNRDRPALDGVSLRVDPGEIVAVTGPSGSGKSTLMSAILGFVTPTAGTVSIGGVDLAELDPDEWRRRIAWVPQRPHLFAGSIDRNVRIGRPGASHEDVVAAIADAGLTTTIERLPDGLDTVVGDRGVGLSAGERQRVALARAFLRDAPLLLLDEPTAGLDGDTESGVIDAIRRLAVGRTVLLVAHRPALIELADRVVPLALAETSPADVIGSRS